MIGVGTRVDDTARGTRAQAPELRIGWRDLDLGTLDPEEERPFWISLSLIPGLGPVGFARIPADDERARRSRLVPMWWQISERGTTDTARSHGRS